MEQTADISEMLDLIFNPAFLVENNRIQKVNEAAARLFLREDLPLEPLFQSGAEEYRRFTGGMLYVTLVICGQSWGASVIRLGSQDIFTLDQEFESEQLQVLALAARELRGPLSNAMLAVQQLSDTGSQDVSRLNRGLYQMLRIIGNMSDASGCGAASKTEIRNIDSLFREITEKAASMLGDDLNIRYSGLEEDVLCPADAQQLERAALNMIANAAKFTPQGGSVHISLSRSGNILRFSVADNGSGIPENIQGTLFRRYLRSPSVEDSRYGIGLGMLLIRNAAANHGGAVLVDRSGNCGTRISITISISREVETTLHTSRLIADYAGDMDHVLLELSELLPPDKF